MCRNFLSRQLSQLRIHRTRHITEIGLEDAAATEFLNVAYHCKPLETPGDSVMTNCSPTNASLRKGVGQPT